MNRMCRTVTLCSLLLMATLLGTSAFGQDDKAAQEAANQSARAKADAICTKCHDENDNKPILALYQSRHGVMGDARTPSCQACHGESDAHVKNPAGTSTRPTPDIVFVGKNKSDANARSGACLACHASGLRTRWSGSQHQTNDVACSNCHTVHTPRDPMVTKDTARDPMTRALQAAVCFTCHREQRADIYKISTHPIEAGKMACSDCHNPHGSAGPKLLKMNTVNETCWTCHADKRGPFLWEHQPVNEDCTNCHTPHGSNITPLLKSRAPFLCDECHDGPHNSQSPFGTAVGGIQSGGVAPGGNPSTSAVGRACLNCHVMIHGTNSPAGAYLHR